MRFTHLAVVLALAVASESKSANLCSSSQTRDASCSAPFGSTIAETHSKQDGIMRHVDALFKPLSMILPKLVLREEAAPTTAEKPVNSPAFKAKKVSIRYGHGIFMGLAFLGFYPLAAIILRLFNFRYVIWIHAGLQIFAMMLMYIGLGLGVWFAKADESLYTGDDPYLVAHTYMGTVIPAVMILQPVLGFLHHRGYLQKGTRTALSYAHIYTGRILILAGAVNGIIGRENEGKDYAHGRTIWSVIFAIVFGTYLIVFCITAYTRRQKAAPRSSSTSSTEIDQKKTPEVRESDQAV